MSRSGAFFGPLRLSAPAVAAKHFVINFESFFGRRIWKKGKQIGFINREISDFPKGGEGANRYFFNANCQI